jgi:hypothetical protein
MLAIWILSVFYFALAAPVPVAVGEKLEARSNAVSAFKDEKVVGEKRYDNPWDNGDNGHHAEQSDEDPPEYYDEPYFPEHQQDNYADSDSDGSGDSTASVDGSHSDDSSDDDDDDANNDDNDNNDNAHNDDDDAEVVDAEPDNDSGDEHDSDSSTGYDGDYENDDEMMHETPEHPEHMTTMTYFEKLLDPVMHRARNFGFGAVGSQRGVTGNR